MAGVSIFHLFMRLKETLRSVPKNAFPLILPEAMERIPFPWGDEVWKVKVTQSPLCYLLGIVLDQDVYSTILLLENYSDEGREF